MDLLVLEKSCEESGPDVPSQDSVVCVPLPLILPVCSHVPVEMGLWWSGGQSSFDKLESSQERLIYPTDIIFFLLNLCVQKSCLSLLLKIAFTTTQTFECEILFITPDLMKYSV